MIDVAATERIAARAPTATSPPGSAGHDDERVEVLVRVGD
jgi:hypothetical protein